MAFPHSPESDLQATVLTLGHPLLRQIAQPVADIHCSQVQQRIDQLLTTVQAANGVGLAAPQLGWSVQILVVASRPNQRYPQAPLMAPTVLINPRLVAASEDSELGWEGCLSLPGVRGQLPRHRSIEVEYLDRQGQPRRQVWEGFVARIFQHEADHLVGKLLIDRLPSESDPLNPPPNHPSIDFSVANE